MEELTIINVITNAYNNSATAANLCKILHYFFDACYVAPAWNLCGIYWHIPCIYHQTMHLNGWIIYEEPNKSNMPINCDKLYNYTFNSVAILIDKIIPDNLTYYIQSFLDKLRYDDLLRRNKIVQSIMLNNISHSVRTPINGILHLTKAISGEQTDNYMLLNQSVMLLANNIFDILDQTKVELNKIVLNKSMINFKQMITSTLEILAEKIQYDIDSSVPEYIYSDQHRIKQILLILIRNAMQQSSKDVYLMISSTLVNLSLENRQHALNKQPIKNADYRHNIKITIKNNHNYSKPELLFAPLIVNCDGDPNLRVSYLLAKLLDGYVQLKETCFEFSFMAYDEEPNEISSRTLTKLRGKHAIVIGDPSDRVINSLNSFEMKITIVKTMEEYNILYADIPRDVLLISTQQDQTQQGQAQQGQAQQGQTQQAISSQAIQIDDSISEIELKMRIIRVIPSDFDATIMVVEDEIINRIIIEKILKKIGYKNIILMQNGMKALKAYTNDIDLLLIDIRMPGMSGFDLANAIHQINPTAKMMGITAQTVSDIDLKPWFKEFIYKPIDINELKNKITKMIDL
jgi:CheY-like chemotaxis protein